MPKENPFLKEIAHHLKTHTGLEEKEILPLIDQPPNPEMGDYTLPCFPLKERLQKPPNLVAQELAQAFPTAELIIKAKAEGGYLNFFVKHAELARWILEKVHKEGNNYGHSTVGRGKTIVIDYSSPNIAKHLAVHHLRSAVIGNALFRLYKARGYHCIGINHLGDWGTQFGQLIVAYKKWGSEVAGSLPTKALKEDPVDALHGLYVKFHEEAKKDPSLEDQARQAFRELEAGDSEARRLWEHFKEVSLKEFNKIYRALGIKFDYYTGESFYNEMLNDTVERLKKAGLATMSEEALVVNLDQYGMPPCLLKKKDEASLYATRDICAAEYRATEFGFSKMLYVVGSEQRLHFKQVFKVLELMGYPWVKDCVHVDFGLIKFKEGKMSTRAGRVILLEEVLKEAIERVKEVIQEKNPNLPNKEEMARQVGIGAVIFADLSSRRTRDVLFDWKEVLNFDGETGPYLQYTHARLCSVIRKYGRPVESAVDLSLLKEKDEYLLVRKLESFPKSTVSAAETCEPVVLCNYLIELASIFNRYYNHHRIIGKNEELTRARILLADCTRQVLRNGLYLLGMETPEEM
ncbi:MAG TPA: arginine--tRNA ligase [Candidatus Hypogeohydataceae bacterium YC41]